MQWRTMTLVAMLSAGLLAAAPGVAGNSGRQEVRRQVESSLAVSGTITVKPDGTVQAYTLDPNAPLGAELAGFVGQQVSQWRFKPIEVDGKVVAAKVPMHLRLVAKPAEKDRLTVTIASTYFGDSAALPPTDNPRSSRMSPPQYPMNAMMMGGQGTVYLIVQVDRDGKVANVDAEQVNLRVAGTRNEMDMLRKQFTDSAIRAARRWTFTIPSTGENAADSHWLVRVPVDYRLDKPSRDKQGGWDTYIPGPRNLRMPWAQEKLQTAGSPDALPDGGVFPLKQGATLLTPPVG